MASVSTCKVAPPSTGSETLIPSTVKLTSLVRPPRICSSPPILVTPACSATISETSETAASVMIFISILRALPILFLSTLSSVAVTVTAFISYPLLFKVGAKVVV